MTWLAGGLIFLAGVAVGVVGFVVVLMAVVMQDEDISRE